MNHYKNRVIAVIAAALLFTTATAQNNCHCEPKKKATRTVKIDQRKALEFANGVLTALNKPAPAKPKPATKPAPNPQPKPTVKKQTSSTEKFVRLAFLISSKIEIKNCKPVCQEKKPTPAPVVTQKPAPRNKPLPKAVAVKPKRAVGTNR